MFSVAKFIQNSDNVLQAKNMTVNKSNGGFQIISRDPVWGLLLFISRSMPTTCIQQVLKLWQIQ